MERTGRALQELDLLIRYSKVSNNGRDDSSTNASTSTQMCLTKCLGTRFPQGHVVRNHDDACGYPAAMERGSVSRDIRKGVPDATSGQSRYSTIRVRLSSRIAAYRSSGQYKTTGILCSTCAPNIQSRLNLLVGRGIRSHDETNK